MLFQEIRQQNEKNTNQLKEQKEDYEERLKEQKQQLAEIKQSLQKKEAEWLQMLKQIYNLSKKPDFHVGLKQALDSLKNSLKNSEQNSPIVQSPLNLKDYSMNKNIGNVQEYAIDCVKNYNSVDEGIVEQIDTRSKISQRIIASNNTDINNKNNRSNVNETYEPVGNNRYNVQSKIPEKSFGVIYEKQDFAAGQLFANYLGNKRQKITRTNNEYNLIDPVLDYGVQGLAQAIKKAAEVDPFDNYRSKQNEYEDKIHKMFQEEQFKKKVRDKTLGKRSPALKISSTQQKTRAQRKRSYKRQMKLTPKQELQRSIYSQDMIGSIVRSLKKEMITVEDIFGPLDEMHTTTPFEFVSPIFCDGFSLTHLVYDTMEELDSFFQERHIYIYNTQRAWTTRKNKKFQDEGKKPKKYFVRLRDENAQLTVEFLSNLGRAMNDLRLVAKGRGIDPIKVFLTKLDDTKDYKGCIYANDWKNVQSKLQTLFEFSCCTYKSSQSCFQFLGKDGQRLKLYNKDLHILQVTSTTKAYGLGIRPIIASRVFRERMARCNDTCMSRIEHSNNFNSIEDEQKFLLNPQTAANLNNMIDFTIAKLNSTPEILKLVNCEINRNDLWQMLFKSIPVTYIFKHKRNVVVVYACMPLYQKFIGLSGDTIAFTTDELAAKFGIPNSKCVCFNITSVGNYSKQQFIKKTKVLQVPILPVGSVDILKFISQIGIDVNELFLQETVDASTVEFEYIGDIEQCAQQNPIPQAHIEIQTAHEIEAVYSSHKGMDIQPISAMSQQDLIHGVRGVNGKLILFNYNSMTKFIADNYSVGKFKKLERLLVQEPQQLISETLYVFVHGLQRNKILELLNQTAIDYEVDVRVQALEKERLKKEEKQRKDGLRQKTISQMQPQTTEMVSVTTQNWDQDKQDFDKTQSDAAKTRESNRVGIHKLKKNGSKNGKRLWQCVKCRKTYRTNADSAPIDSSLCVQGSRQNE